MCMHPGHYKYKLRQTSRSLWWFSPSGMISRGLLLRLTLQAQFNHKYNLRSCMDDGGDIKVGAVGAAKRLGYRTQLKVILSV